MASLAEMLSGKSKEKLNTLSKQNSQSKKSNKKSDTFKVRIPDFVAVDLETTGLNKKQDRVTEIGMVLYVGGKEVASYSKLINPEMPIPKEIVKLTGITDEAVKNAPKFSEIADEVLDFIGRYAICGHQVDFDFNFLNVELERAGYKKLRNWQIDTLSTARMLLTNEEGYNLGKVALSLGIDLENAHRALDDARASGEIALKLLPKLGELPPITRKQLAHFAPFSLTKKILEASVKNCKIEGNKSQNKRDFGKIIPTNENYKLSKDEINSLLISDGKVSSLIKGYQYRESQEEFANIVVDCLNGNKKGVVEAGTGTGKSLSYLLPSSLWALNLGKRVVVSTNTKNLQDQLVEKELKNIKKIVGEKLTFTTLKGKGNYLCKEGLENFLSGKTGNVSTRERSSMMPLIKWAYETKTGDIDELNSFNQKYYSKIWNIISAENKRCSIACPHFNDCFMLNAKEKARNSHIVVVNHSLFYSDILTNSSFVGRADAIIFDEAHNLEKAGLRILSVSVDTKRIDTTLDSIQQISTTIQNRSKKSDSRLLEEHSRIVKKIVKRFRKNYDQLVEEIINWGSSLEGNADEKHNGISVIQYKEKVLGRYSGVSGFKIALDDSIDELNEISQLGSEITISEALVNEIKSAIIELTQLRADLRFVVDANSEDDIFWLEIPENHRWFKLIGNSITVDSFLENFWKNSNIPTILTSATLTYKDDLSYFIDRIGLKDFTPITAIITSDFKTDNRLFISRTDTPEPVGHGFISHIADELFELREKFKRNMLVLFTNNATIKEVYDLLEAKFEGKHKPVFAQGISGNRAWITQQMNEVEGAILLGSGSFWEGVDIPGSSCEIVVIPKLPFPVPSHPLTKAIAEHTAEIRGRNSFIDYHLPEALLTFKQGVGRLIRHHNDRGVLIVLDPRINEKGYGKKFITLINNEHFALSSKDDMYKKMEEFFIS